MFCCGQKAILAQIELEESAAISIQKAVRGHNGRIEAKELRVENNTQLAKVESVASAAINKVVRGFLGRAKAKIIKHESVASTAINKVARGFLDREKAKIIKVKGSIERIQRDLQEKKNLIITKNYELSVVRRVIADVVGDCATNNNQKETARLILDLKGFESRKQCLLKGIESLENTIGDLKIQKDRLEEDLEGRERSRSSSSRSFDSLPGQGEGGSPASSVTTQGVDSESSIDEEEEPEAVSYPESWAGKGAGALSAIEEYCNSQPQKADAAKLHIFTIHSKVKALGFITFMKEVLLNPKNYSKNVSERFTKLTTCYNKKIGKLESIFLLQFQKLIQRETGEYKLKTGEEEFYNRVDATKGFIPPEVRRELLSEAGGSSPLHILYDTIAKMEFSKEMTKGEKAAISEKLQKDLAAISGLNHKRIREEGKAGADPRAIATSVLMEYIINN